MKALIFAAGLGTRLRPYTDSRPKALVEVAGIPLLEIQLRRLMAAGFTEVVVNVHHYADMMEAFLARFQGGPLRIAISDERDLLRETGGGLLHARPLLDGDEPIYICNVDVLTNLDPKALLDIHTRHAALATLAVMERPTSRRLLFEPDMRFSGWENTETGTRKGNPGPDPHSLAFSGQQIVSPEIFPLIHRTGVFSIIDVYLDLADTGRIYGHRDDSLLWMDVGKPAELDRAASILDKVLP